MEKTNKQFMLLSAIGIILVVDAHAWTSLQLFSAYIPYNSFFMPMFVFISGYFVKPDSKEKAGSYITRKFKRLMIPFYLWTVFYMGIEFVLHNLGYISYDYVSFRDFLIKPWTKGSVVSIASPMWFVPSLFATELLYYVIRRVFSKIWREGITFLLFVSLGCLCVEMSVRGFSSNEFLLLPLKVGFFLQFYQMGRLYKLYGEAVLKKCKKWPVLILLLLVNTIRAAMYNSTYDIAFNDISIMGGFTTNDVLLPFISSFIGITFWLCIVEILTPSLEDSKLLNYISNNTFWIMSTHVFMFNIYNVMLLFINKYLFELAKFDAMKVHSTAWYRYEPISQFRLFYFVAGLFGSIFSKYIFDCLKIKIKSAYRGVQI